MKKQVIIISGIVLAVIAGFVFYFISIPNNSSAALYSGDRTGNYCKITVGGETWEKPCATLWSSGSDIGGTLGAGSVSCNENGTCSYETSSGSYGGTTGTYFTQATAAAFMQQGGTQQQVDAIDGIYVACQNLLASKPTDGGMDPRGVSCGDYKWDCRPGYGLACKNIDNDNWVGNPNQPDTTRCADIQPGTGGGECGGQRPNCGLTTGGGILPVDVNTVSSNRNEFNPNSGFGTTILRPGVAGAQVSILQHFLTAEGFYTGTIDGSYGKGTTSAVAAWQAAEGLKGDGVFGSTSNERLVHLNGKHYYCKAGNQIKICKDDQHPTGATCETDGNGNFVEGGACSIGSMTGTTSTQWWTTYTAPNNNSAL